MEYAYYAKLIKDGFGGPSASGFDFDEYDMDMEIE